MYVEVNKFDDAESTCISEESVVVSIIVTCVCLCVVCLQDAHNCLLDFDEDTSLFAVYDGHGGHEVALYTSQKLPDYIKGTDAYGKGDLENALINAFLDFDATIATREVVAVLKELAGTVITFYK